MLDGVLRGIDEGWFQGEIADSAYELERALQDGRRVVVGVNAFTEGNDEAQIELLRITHEQEQLQVKRLGAVKADRDSDAVARTLARVAADAADPEVNLMPALLDAVHSYATEGEIITSLADVFGRYTETPVL
jgi:methylmalonyl-CoA mutase N-terminal domain/subunit